MLKGLLIRQQNKDLIMRQCMQDYLDSFTKDDAVHFFKENKEKDKFISESEEFFNALWNRMLELLKEKQNEI